MMQLFSFLNSYADQIGGQFTSYDHSKAIVVVPVINSRFQTVLIITDESSRTGIERVTFSSQVCEFHDKIDAKSLLERVKTFDYSKFVLQNNQLSIEASCSLQSASEDEVKSILQEVALLADEYELKFTGKDIH